MSSTLLTITADDYNGNKAINDGIIEAIDHGVISAVSAFTNTEDSLVNLKTLHDHINKTKKPVGIGVHLTLTSGNCLTGDKLKFLWHNDKSYIEHQLPTYDNFHITNYQDKLLAFRDEFDSQMRVLYDAGIPIDHISAHHGIPFLDDLLVDVIIQLAREYGKKQSGLPIPVRSVLNSQRVHNWKLKHSPFNAGVFESESFSKTRDRVTKALVFDNLLRTRFLDFSKEKVLDRARMIDSKRVYMPDLFIDAYYGQPSERNLKDVLSALVSDYKYVFTSNEFIQDAYSYRHFELNVHLSKTASPSPFLINGVNPSYFPGRHQELEILVKHCKNLLTQLSTSNKIDLVSFSEAQKIRLA